MPKFRVRAEGDVWDELRVDAEKLAARVRAEEIDLNQLGKILSSVVRSSAAAFVKADLPSVRLEAATKALDLKTPKTELERFARGGASKD